MNLLYHPAARVLCECGCGAPTPLRTRTARHLGLIAGEPARFIPGHNNRRDAQSRFWGKVEQEEGGCWNWIGATSGNGYGSFVVNGVKLGAHRFAYEDRVGAIPDGLTLDHLCRNRRCVNPDHLEPVTITENIRRAKAAVTHCPSGHPYTEENTLSGHASRRKCRQCASLANRRAMAKRQRQGRTLATVLSDLREARDDWHEALAAIEREERDSNDRATEAETRLSDLRDEFDAMFHNVTGLTVEDVRKCYEGAIL